MSETLIVVAAAIVAAVFGYALARARGRGETASQGRLTLDSQVPAATTKLTTFMSSSSSTVADAVESMVASQPEPAPIPPPTGAHVSIKASVTRIFKLPSKDLADAIAERERAQGMSVVVAPPDSTNPTWRVTSTK